MDKITQIKIRKESGCQCNVWTASYERLPLVKIEIVDDTDFWGTTSTFMLYKEGMAIPDSADKDCMNSEGTVIEVFFEGGHYETFQYEEGWPHLKEFFNTWSTNGNIIPGNEQTVTFDDSDDFIV